MAVIYAVMAALAAFVALGFAYRVSVVALFLIFTCVELIDVTNYLNHYYLVSLLLLLMSFLPLHRTWSLDARICPARASQTLPALTDALLAAFPRRGGLLLGGDCETPV